VNKIQASLIEHHKRSSRQAPMRALTAARNWRCRTPRADPLPNRPRQPIWSGGGSLGDACHGFIPVALSKSEGAGSGQALV